MRVVVQALNPPLVGIILGILAAASPLGPHLFCPTGPQLPMELKVCFGKCSGSSLLMSLGVYKNGSQLSAESLACGKASASSLRSGFGGRRKLKVEDSLNFQGLKCCLSFIRDHQTRRRSTWAAGWRVARCSDGGSRRLAVSTVLGRRYYAKRRPVEHSTAQLERRNRPAGHAAAFPAACLTYAGAWLSCADHVTLWACSYEGDKR